VCVIVKPGNAEAVAHWGGVGGVLFRGIKKVTVQLNDKVAEGLTNFLKHKEILLDCVRIKHGES